MIRNLFFSLTVWGIALIHFSDPGAEPKMNFTSPNGSCTETKLQANHLKHLYQLTETKANETNPVRNTIDEFTAALNTAKTKDGIEYRKSKNGYYKVAPLEKGFNYLRFARPANNSEVFILLQHNHVIPGKNNTGLSLPPIPDVEDLFAFAHTYYQMGERSVRNAMVYIVVTRNGLYALKVKSREDLLYFYDKLHDPLIQEAIINKFKKEVVNKATQHSADKCNNQKGGCTSVQLDELTDQYINDFFIEFINNFNEDFGSGIDIYKGSFHLATKSYTWNKATH